MRPRQGWRLALEPFGTDIAWSLLSILEGSATTDVAAGFLRNMSWLKELVDQIDQPAGHADDSAWPEVLTTPATEHSLALALRCLIPARLRQALLRDAGSEVTRHTVTVVARGWLAKAPWDTVALDDLGTIRLMECARLLNGLSPALFSGLDGRPRHATSPAARSLAIIDPGPVSSRSEPPLYAGRQPAILADHGLVPRDSRYSRRAISTDEFGVQLRDPAGWSNLLYLGHVRPGPADMPAGTGLVFADGTRTDLLTARTWLAEPERWPSPERVALIGCASDGGAAFEQTGLVVAAIRAGARIVTSTRWTLPTDPAPPSPPTTSELACAVNAAHAAADPVDAVRRWQLDRLAAWRAHPGRETSPVVWASLVTSYAPKDVTGG